MKVRTVLFVAGLFVVGLLLGIHVYAEKAEGSVYELRTYTAAEGRLPDLHRRFSDHTLRLFEKHGMKNVIYLDAHRRGRHSGLLAFSQERSCGQTIMEGLSRRSRLAERLQGIDQQRPTGYQGGKAVLGCHRLLPQEVNKP